MIARTPGAAKLAGLALAASASAAHASELVVTVRDRAGAPVADAVVTVEMPGRKAPARYAQPLRVSQRDQKFVPFVLVVPVGAEVNFANEDRFRHQVFSFSKAKTFELRLFGRDETHSVRFPKAGTVALGCNIHDNMLAYIRVVDAPFAELTDRSGRAVVRDLPAGPARVHVWQPHMRAPDNELSAEVALPAAGSVARELTAPVVAPPPM